MEEEEEEEETEVEQAQQAQQAQQAAEGQAEHQEGAAPALPAETEAVAVAQQQPEMVTEEEVVEVEQVIEVGQGHGLRALNAGWHVAGCDRVPTQPACAEVTALCGQKAQPGRGALSRCCSVRGFGFLRSGQEPVVGTVGFALFLARCAWMARPVVAPGAARSKGWYAGPRSLGAEGKH